MKKTTSMNIDADVIQRAKMMGLNMGEVAERALKDKLSIKDVAVNIDPTHCEFCNKKGTKATAKNPNKGLTWLYPDERWICPTCLSMSNRGYAE